MSKAAPPHSLASIPASLRSDCRIARLSTLTVVGYVYLVLV